MLHYLPNTFIQKIENLLKPMVVKTMQEINEEETDKKILLQYHDYYSIVWIKNAIGNYAIDFNNYTLNPNTIYFLNPTQVAHLFTESNPDGYVLMFNDDFLIQSKLYIDFLHRLGFFYRIDEVAPLQVSEEMTAILQPIVEALQYETTHVDEFTYEVIGALLKLFLLICKRMHTHQENTLLHTVSSNIRAFHIVREFKQLVGKNFREKHKVGDYALLMELTAAHLNEIIKQEADITPKDYIVRRIMTEAKKMALFTDAAAKDVATLLGFDDPAHFSKLFKNTEKVSFSEFRATYLLSLQKENN
jgi:AraC family transcriptional regulator, transcriptional activator of pobA